MRTGNCPFCLSPMPIGDEMPDERCCHDCAIDDVWFKPRGDQQVFAIVVPPLAGIVHVRAESAEAARERVIESITATAPEDA